ncbi:MAG: hypothetical protein HWE25_00765 [Alphaproteobacteria bacterium]|nr:hypothetical protein [Alphaproteobacteria bacterium]
MARKLGRRLKTFENRCQTDRNLLEAIIMDGHWEGLGASPYHSQLADVYWQAAALLVEQYGVDHVNKLTQLED